MSYQSRKTVWNRSHDDRFESVNSTHICPCGTVRLRLLRTFSLPYDRHTSRHRIAKSSCPAGREASKSAFIFPSVSWKREDTVKHQEHSSSLSKLSKCDTRTTICLSICLSKIYHLQVWKAVYSKRKSMFSATEHEILFAGTTECISVVQSYTLPPGRKFYVRKYI